jgi:hydrogenase nickel incorporation protein HypB
VLLINKLDLLSAGVVDFDIDKVKADCKTLNKDIEIFSVSARTGEGMNGWYDWLVSKAKK